jgi:hypothetical protein
MTQEEKAKAYDKAIERARLSRLQLLDIGEEATEIEYIFPELKESEDERISKEIIKYLEQTVPHNHRDEVLKSKEWTAWLQKQGKQKSEWSEEDRTMAFTLMRDVDQMPYYISKEGKNERIEWLNSLEDKFNNRDYENC